MDNLNSISMAYSPATDTIAMLGAKDYRAINQEFYDVLVQITQDRPPLEFNVRGKNYIVRVEQK